MHDELKKKLDRLNIPSPATNLQSRIIEAAERFQTSPHTSSAKRENILSGVLLGAIKRYGKSFIPLAAFAVFLLVVGVRDTVHEPARRLEGSLSVLSDISFFEETEESLDNDFFSEDIFWL